MRQFTFSNGHGCSKDFNLKFLAFPTFTYGREVTQEKAISGKVGTLISKTGSYTDTTISNNLEFESESIEKYYSDADSIRAWLLSSKKLVYSDMENKFFVVKKVEIGDIKRKYGVFGEFIVTFTCNSSTYLADGQEPVFPGTIYNPHSWSQPVYKITGSGSCTLTVNGKTMTVTVTDNIIIDTERMVAYSEDGTLKNTSVSGYYEDLYLQSGENTVSITNGFSCSIIPNWRCL